LEKMPRNFLNMRAGHAAARKRQARQSSERRSRTQARGR
jgi:hypothetical protein